MTVPIVASALAVAVLTGHLALALARRPQRGLLLLAALLPFDGLLLILPGGSTAGMWKEALLSLTLLATIVAPPAARRDADQAKQPLPGWAVAAVVVATLGALSALWLVSTGAVTVAVVGLKVTFFYLLVPVALWRCPFDERDRDRLVTILMATGAVTAAVGLVQQAVGHERLHDLGYEYNETIRFAGGLLRSFSTFTQPFSFGLYVALVLLVCLPVALGDPRRVRNTLFLMTTPVLVVGMSTSVVRGAFLSLVAGLLLLGCWRHRGLAHLIGPLALGLLLVPATVTSAFLSSSSLDARATGWALITDRVLSAPLGNGLGVTSAAAEKSLQSGAPLDQVISVGGQAYQPDNYYIKVLLELGPLGLWAFLLLGAGAVAAAFRAAREATGADQALASGIAASLVGGAAASFVSTYLEIFPLDFYFWLLLGVLLCLDRSSSSTPSLCDRTAPVSRPTSESSSGP